MRDCKMTLAEFRQTPVGEREVSSKFDSLIETNSFLSRTPPLSLVSKVAKDTKLSMRNFRLPPRCSWGLRSSGMLHRLACPAWSLKAKICLILICLQRKDQYWQFQTQWLLRIVTSVTLINSAFSHTPCYTFHITLITKAFCFPNQQ
jgi:hypothetical protein